MSVPAGVRCPGILRGIGRTELRPRMQHRGGSDLKKFSKVEVEVTDRGNNSGRWIERRVVRLRGCAHLGGRRRGLFNHRGLGLHDDIGVDLGNRRGVYS